ncbi:MAG: hypothetical protein AUI14_00320 [Actinobacteria bacterium 13_2_20CM_2_71_6]|nr:MAG: hypothetical protein AUI14_00320 [Actinobacteria bacterium 13_2_20CM_2_71_6]
MALGSEAVTLRVAYDGAMYPAEPIAKGAAYELFAENPAPGFLRNPRPGASAPYRRFVPAGDVQVVEGAAPVPTDEALRAPVSRALSWAAVHRLSQTPPLGELLATIRGSVRVRRGTRMVKVLSAAQLGEYLRGALPRGFCYREYDIAHLRTPSELGVLRADGEDAGPGTDEVVFALRWRAVDPVDYEIPYATGYEGLVRMPPHNRLGPTVLGTGFAPSGQQLIPEYVTAHLADLPLSALAELVAYTADGTEVVLYRYLPEQRAWSRMVGPQWRHLFSHVSGVVPEQEYFPVPETPTCLVGWYRGREFEAIADPPSEFRVLAKTRAARYSVDALARRTRYLRWRGLTCTVVRDDGDWLRVRLVRPDNEATVRAGATCLERGVYETWAPYAETDGHQSVDVRYELSQPEIRLAA